MCAMIQKLRMNFGSIRVRYRLQRSACWVFDGGLSLRGREATRRSKPCRANIQFAINRGRAQPDGRAARLSFSEESSNDETNGDFSVFGGCGCSCRTGQEADDASRGFAGGTEVDAQ